MGIALEGSAPKPSSGTLSSSRTEQDPSLTTPSPFSITGQSPGAGTQRKGRKEWGLWETGRGLEDPGRDDRGRWVLAGRALKTGNVPEIRCGETLRGLSPGTSGTNTGDAPGGDARGVGNWECGKLSEGDGAGTSQRERREMNRSVLWEVAVMQGDKRARGVWLQIWEMGHQWRLHQKK